MINKNSRPLVFYKKLELKNLSEKKLKNWKALVVESLSNKAIELAHNFIEKETLVKMFCCDFCKFFLNKNTCGWLLLFIAEYFQLIPLILTLCSKFSSTSICMTHFAKSKRASNLSVFTLTNFLRLTFCGLHVLSFNNQVIRDQWRSF